MKRKLPIYELKINPTDDAIVSAIALVEQPAIESNFLSFSKNEELVFAANDERMELIGAAMIPDQLIYRRNEKTGEEFEVFFSTDTIRQIAQEYFKSGFQKNLNMEHSSVPAKSYIFQSYITDKSKGIDAPKGIDVPEGSWIVGVKVDDKEVWNDIKLGKVKGFSIEGMFEFIQSKFSNDELNESEALELLQSLNNIIDKLNKK